MQDKPPHPDDPFGGLGPQPTRCRWLSPEDEARAGPAKVIRVIIDGTRGDTHWANEAYQRHVLREIAAFTGPTKAVVVTPAGMITTTSPWLEGNLASVGRGLTLVDEALGQLDFGPTPLETLLGIDACVPGEATPLQAVVHLQGNQRSARPENTTFKLYPNNGESAWLVGWLLVSAIGSIPSELTKARRIETSAGGFLVLVCHDACVFSRRSQAHLKDANGLRVREHFAQSAKSQPPIEFALIATHYQETSRSGGVFKNAANVVNEESGATVITTMFAPKDAIAEIAACFPVRGKRSEEVVTLLIEDTLEFENT